MAEVNKINLRLLARLIETGITSEKQVLALKLKDILSLPHISKQELSAICDLQDAIKAGSIMAFLATPENMAENEEEASQEDTADEA
jgi:hypothetical protein